MTESNFSAIRARLRYESIEEFTEGYARFISAGGMFIPMAPTKLKPIGTTIRFQFLLADGSTALLGEALVVQVRPPDDTNPKAPVGMLVKFSKLSQDSKALVDDIVEGKKSGSFISDEPSEPEPEPAAETAEPEPEPEEEFDDFLPPDDEPAAAPANVHDTPTTEAPDPDEATAPAPSEPAGPRKLGQTEGGLQILAFDDISDEDANAMSLDLGEESDIDEMFQGLFGGDDEADDDAIFGDMFGGGSADASMEFSPDDDFESEDEVAEAEPEPEPEEEFGLFLDPSEAEPSDEPAEVETPSEPELDAPDDVDDVEDVDDAGAFEEAPDLDPLDQFADSEPEEVALAESSGHEEEPSEPDDAYSEDGQEADADFEDAAVSEPSEEDEDEAALAAEALLAEEASDETADAAEEEEGYEFDVISRPSMESDEERAAEPFFEGEEEMQAPSDADFEVGGEESDVEMLALESSAVELLEGSEVEELLEEDEDDEGAEEDEGVAADDGPPDEGFQIADEGPSELENLLGNLEDEPDHDHDMDSLNLASNPEIVIDDAPPAPLGDGDEDEESLEFLLAAAKNEIQEKQTDDTSSEKDILDELLGDDAGLPPPPADAPVFQATPPTEKQKKGGFLSKLFGKD